MINRRAYCEAALALIDARFKVKGTTDLDVYFGDELLSVETLTVNELYAFTLGLIAGRRLIKEGLTK